MENTEGISKEQAYDQARKEFYDIRQQEDIQRRVALEEARMVGGYFGKSRMQVSMELEDATYEKWKKWAEGEAAKIQSERDSAYANFGNEDNTSTETVGLDAPDRIH